MDNVDYKNLKFSILEDLEQWAMGGSYAGNTFDDSEDIPWEDMVRDSGEDDDFDSFMENVCPLVIRYHLRGLSDEDLQSILDRRTPDEIGDLYYPFEDESLISEAAHGIVSAILFNILDGKGF